MAQDGKLLFAKAGADLSKKFTFIQGWQTAHGFVCGATGTADRDAEGLAESFSALGVPVFLADVKGDLSGMIRPGADKEAERCKKAIERSVKNVASATAGTLGRQVGNLLGGRLGGKFGKTLGGNLGASLSRNILGTLFRK